MSALIAMLASVMAAFLALFSAPVSATASTKKDGSPIVGCLAAGGIVAYGASLNDSHSRPAPVPEPATLAVLSIGMVGAIRYRARRRR